MEAMITDMNIWFISLAILVTALIIIVVFLVKKHIDWKIAWKDERSGRLRAEKELRELQTYNRTFPEKTEKAYNVEDNLSNKPCFEDLIADISALFVNKPVEELDEIINYSLKACARFFGADRSYVFLFNSDMKYINNTHEWCADNLASYINNSQDIPVSSMPRWFEKICNKEYVTLSFAGQVSGAESLSVTESLPANEVLPGNEALPGNESLTGTESLTRSGSDTGDVSGANPSNVADSISANNFDSSANSGPNSGGRGADDILFFEREVLSLLCMPLVSDGRLIGFLGFESVKNEKIRSEKEISFLKIVAEIFASAIDKRNTIKALMESEKRFRQIFENMDEVLLWSGDYFQMQYVSPAYEKVWGRKRKSLYDNPAAFVEAIYHEDKPSVLEAFESYAQGEPFDVEYRILQPDGEIRWVWDRSFPVRNDTGDLIRQTGIAVDITHRKKMEIELEESREAAEAASIAKSRFLANMSHEIRTPFSAIQGIIELFSETELSGLQSEYIALLKFSADSLVKIINDILDISKIEMGNMELFSEHFDLDFCIGGIVHLFQPAAKKKGVSLESKIAPELPRFVRGDSEKIKQILINLLNNALKFTEKGKIILAAELGDEREEDFTLIITIKDTGIGIPKDKLGGIFEPFTQVDNTIQRKYGGTGLGLSITEKLIKMMDGGITINSDSNSGTEVVFSIVLEKSESNANTEDLSPQIGGFCGGEEVKKIHVLIVEDNQVNQMLTGKTLVNAGHTYSLALNGKEALDLYSKEEFDLILMDIQMPEMDGYTATKRIREIEKDTGKKTPIVALTAHAMPGDREKSFEAGMDYYLAKPLYTHKLISIIKYLFGSGKADGKAEPDKDYVTDTDTEKDDYGVEVKYKDAINLAREREKKVEKDVNALGLLKKINNDLDFFERLLENFKKTSADLLKDLDDALKADDGDKIKFAAHTIKGSLIIFGDGKGSEIAQELESLGFEDNVAAIQKAEELKNEVKKTLEFLDQFLKEKR